MPSPQIFLRLSNDAYEQLQKEAREGETISQTAQRILTFALTGQEEIYLQKAGRPKGSKKLPSLEERVKLLEDRIFGDDK